MISRTPFDMAARYPLGTDVRAATSLAHNAPIAVGTMRGYSFAKDRITGEGIAGKALLRTDNSPMAVPVVALKGRIATAPPARVPGGAHV